LVFQKEVAWSSGAIAIMQKGEAIVLEVRYKINAVCGRTVALVQF